MEHQHESEWRMSLKVAEFAPNTGMVPVKSGTLLAVQAEIDRLNAQRRELQAERERMLDSLARAGLEASRMVRQERHEIAQWLDGQGQPGYAHEVRYRR